MGIIEETRQVLQDFVTPEFRAIDARLTALEKRVDAMDNKLDRNHAETMSAIHRIENYAAVLERLARLEAKVQSAA